MRKKGNPSKTRRIQRTDKGGEGRKGFARLKEWFERQEAVPGAISENDEQELRSFGPETLVRSFSRLFRESPDRERGKILVWMVPVLGERAAEFFVTVLESDTSRLAEKRMALDHLRKMGASAEPALAEAVDQAWDFVVEVFPALVKEHGEEDRLGEQGWDRIRNIPANLSGAVVRELLERCPVEALTLCAYVLDQKQDFLEEVLDVFAEAPHEDAARFLRSAYQKVVDKSLKKKIKRVNHKRRGKGLPSFDLEADKEERSIWSPPVPPEPVGLFSLSDSPEFRMVWVIRPNVPKGMLVFAGWLHDGRGLIQFFVLDLSSREAEKFRDSMFENKDMTVVEADSGYCAHLLEEAYRKGAPQDPKEAELYRGYRTLLKEVLPSGTPLPPIHNVFREQEEGEVPGDPLGESANLLNHARMQAWMMEPGRVKPYVEKLMDISESKLIIHPMQKKERTEAFYREVAQELFSDSAYRTIWKARVLDMAWVMHAKGEAGLARRLFDVGRYLEDPGRDASRVAFFSQLVQRTLEGWLKQQETEEKEKPSLIVKPT